MIEENGLPEYSLRINPRAKYVSIKICPRRGLVVVIPNARAKNAALQLLEEKREWIEKHYRKIVTPSLELVLPDVIHFPAIDKQFSIHYQSMYQAKTLRLIEAPGMLTLYGDISDQQRCRKLLMNWCRKQAPIILGSLLETVAKKCDLTYRSLSIRDQKTRWGSCSRVGEINLNYRLIFMSYQHVYYIIVHELCHTIHFDHSPKFWELVEKFVPDYLQLKKALRNSQSILPGWLR